jgi:hypothetical protein
MRADSGHERCLKAARSGRAGGGMEGEVDEGGLVGVGDGELVDGGLVDTRGVGCGVGALWPCPLCTQPDRLACLHLCVDLWPGECDLPVVIAGFVALPPFVRSIRTA